jgi:small nuclear ribonucleoprotein E
MPPKRVKRVMTLPINVIFSHLQVSNRTPQFLSLSAISYLGLTHVLYFILCPQKKTRVRIWLYEDTKTQLEGQIIGFDEYMNVVLDEAVEIGKKRVEVGRILVKGDSITLMQEAQPPPKALPVEEES